MKVVISTVGRFHLFAMARELQAKSALKKIFSGFTSRSLARENIERDNLQALPIVRPIVVALDRLPFQFRRPIPQFMHWLSLKVHDLLVSVMLPACDVFVGHQGVGLYSGRKARKRGALHICDVGAPHIVWRERLLAAEYARWGLERDHPLAAVVRDEVQEYAEADLITVPSSFVKQSFIAEGVAEAKICVVPYGVRLEHFHPVKDEFDEPFQVLFVGRFSFRKGAIDLIEAFQALEISNKRLVVVGTVERKTLQLISARSSLNGVTFLGHVQNDQLKHIMSASSALILPSIEEGFGLVAAEAMACGCPVIITENTGATDIVSDGQEGLIVPVRSPTALSNAMMKLSVPSTRRAMSEAALEKVKSLGGWGAYSDLLLDLFGASIEQRREGK